MISNIYEVIAPVFLLIGAGFLAVWLKAFPAAGVSFLSKYVQNFAAPCLLFTGVSTLDLGQVFDAGLLISFYAGAILCFLIGTFGARHVFGRRPGESVAIGFGALFSNSLLLGIPISERAYGADSLAPNFAIISIHAPLCYLIGIAAMEYARADGRGAAATVRVIARQMFRNALSIGIAFGFLVNLGNIPVPETVTAAVEMLARSTLPAALFGLGGTLVGLGIANKIGPVLMITALSLLLHPAITWVLGTSVFGLPHAYLQSAVLTAAMAPGVNSFVFATMYDRAVGEAASTVFVATLVSILTIALWLTVLGT